jgi:hypothetical protein
VNGFPSQSAFSAAAISSAIDHTWSVNPSAIAGDAFNVECFRPKLLDADKQSDRSLVVL